MFDSFDEKNVGMVPLDMFGEMIDDLGEGFSGEELNALKALVDPDGTNKVSRTAFISWYVNLVTTSGGSDDDSLDSDDRTEREASEKDAEEKFASLATPGEGGKSCIKTETQGEGEDDEDVVVDGGDLGSSHGWDNICADQSGGNKWECVTCTCKSHASVAKCDNCGTLKLETGPPAFIKVKTGEDLSYSPISTGAATCDVSLSPSLNINNSNGNQIDTGINTNISDPTSKVSYSCMPCIFVLNTLLSSEPRLTLGALFSWPTPCFPQQLVKSSSLPPVVIAHLISVDSERRNADLNHKGGSLLVKDQVGNVAVHWAEEIITEIGQEDSYDASSKDDDGDDSSSEDDNGDDSSSEDDDGDDSSSGDPNPNTSDGGVNVTGLSTSLQPTDFYTSGAAAILVTLQDGKSK